MKKVRVELGIILEINVDEPDEKYAMDLAENIAYDTLTNNYTSENIFDNADDGIRMVNASARALECEEDDNE